jgi:hypothetical protein
MNRRGFLGAMLGAMAAPAVCKAENLMKIVVPKKDLILLQDLNIAEIYPKEIKGLNTDFDGDVLNWVYETNPYSEWDEAQAYVRKTGLIVTAPDGAILIPRVNPNIPDRWQDLSLAEKINQRGKEIMALR